MKRPNFVIFFLIIIGVCGLAGFSILRYAARSGVTMRRDESRAHLLALGQLLNHRPEAPEHGELPESLSALVSSEHAELTVNPSWPDETGYIYVTGARRSDPPDSLLLYENVPPEKRKLGRQVLRLDGTVELLSEERFQQRFNAQHAAWDSNHRPWRLEEVTAR